MNRVRNHFNEIAKNYDYYKNKNWYYYKNLKILLSKVIPKNKNVLEIGCGVGDLLSYLEPEKGWGMDLSDEMIKRAKFKHKYNNNLTFSTKYPGEKYDYVFMSDVVEHLEDPKKVIKRISKLMDKNSLLINTMANPIWEPILMLGEKVGFKMPEGPHNRIKYYEIVRIINKNDLKIVKHNYKLLMPVYIPIITSLFNRYLERYFKKYAFIEYFVAKKK